FDEVRHQDAIDQESGTVFDDYRQFPNLLHKTKRALQYFRRRLARGDDFNQLHPMNWVEEMETKHALGLMRRGRKFRDWQRRGVGGENRVFAGQFIERLKDLLFE